MGSSIKKMKRLLKLPVTHALFLIAIILLLVLTAVYLPSALVIALVIGWTCFACVYLWICTRTDIGKLSIHLLVVTLTYVVAGVWLTSGWATLPFALVVIVSFLSKGEGYEWSINKWPELYYGLVRLARRGRSSWVRILFLMSALAGLVFAFQTRIRFLGQGWFDPGPGVSIN